MTPEELKLLVGNKVFSVDQMEHFQYRFSEPNTLTIGGLAIPQRKANYEFIEQNGKIYLVTINRPISPSKLFVKVLSTEKPTIIEIYYETNNKVFATLRSKV